MQWLFPPICLSLSLSLLHHPNNLQACSGVSIVNHLHTCSTTNPFSTKLLQQLSPCAMFPSLFFSSHFPPPAPVCTLEFKTPLKLFFASFPNRWTFFCMCLPWSGCRIPAAPFLFLGHSLNICDLYTCWLSFVSWLLSGFNPELWPFPLDALFQVALISPRLSHHFCADNVLIYIFVLNCFTFAC